MRLKTLLAAGAMAAVAGSALPAAAQSTLDEILDRGEVNCGVTTGLAGFSNPDSEGNWTGLDADVCRALAAAVLGDADAVNFTPSTAQQRFQVLQSGEVDLLSRVTTWTLTRDTSLGMNFAPTTFYDGQGFMVRRSLSLTSATELIGARMCVQAGSTTELNLADFFRARNLRYEPVVLATEDEARETYAREGCDALTADVSALAAARTTLANPQSHMILPEVISKEPLGPVVRRGDDQWADVVRWTLNALILAEELGVTADNAAQLAAESADPHTRRLLGAEGDFGAMLALENDWALTAIAATGNYGEIFDRNIGSRSPLDLARGLNAQWNARPAGQMYGLPVR